MDEMVKGEDIAFAWGIIIFMVILCFCVPTGKGSPEEQPAESESPRLVSEASFPKNIQGIFQMTLEGHEYLVWSKYGEPGGICHSASCPCRANEVYQEEMRNENP